MRVFVIGDTHFGHANILNFKKADGTLMRTKPGGFPFLDVHEMDHYMVECWNSVVTPEDRVYHLGDVAMKKDGLEMLDQCNGHKRLVMGNHDIFDAKLYLKYFDKLCGVRVFDDFVLSHIPLREAQISGNRVNVHGHLHANCSPEDLGPKYFNVSAEVIGYTPVTLEQVKEAVKNGRMTI